MATLSHEDFIKAIESMTLLEVSELVKALEEKFGVSAAAPVVVAGGAAAGAAVEEQTEFDLVLESAGGNKIAGPALIEEAGSTILVPNAAGAEVDSYGNYLIHL